MNVIIISIGDELLSGRTVDTNSAWLSSELERLGIHTLERITVHDDISAIVEALETAKNRTELCIIMGGLGPTNDDVTKEALSRFSERELTAEPASLKMVVDKYTQRGLVIPENGIPKEALMPSGAIALANSVGVAPGILLGHNGFTIIALPGVPHELKDIFSHGVTDFLAKFPAGTKSIVESIYTTGIPESKLFAILEPIIEDFPELKIAFYPSFYGVEVRLVGTSADAEFYILHKAIYDKASSWCYSTTEGNLPAVIGEILSSRGQRISLAESCTGGLIASRLVDVSGASGWFEGGVVSYSNESKIELLGVERTAIEQFGAVSGIVAEQMARGAAKRFQTEFALSTTGVAGPTGGTPEKPVGLVFYALHTPYGTIVRSNIISGPREAHRHRTSQSALAMLHLALENKYDEHIWADGSREFKT